MIVDSHQHFWDPSIADYPWMTDEVASLRRRFSPEDLEPLLREHGVSARSSCKPDTISTRRMTLLAMAAATPFVLGVVGWVDLTRDVGRQLADLDGTLVGVRHQVHDEPDPAWLLRDDVQRGLAAVGGAGLVYDLLVRARELPAAVETARRHPGVRFVLDHAGKAPRSDRDAWAEGVSALAELPNVTCKLSGLFTEARPRRDGRARAALVRPRSLHVRIGLAGMPDRIRGTGTRSQSSATTRTSGGDRSQNIRPQRILTKPNDPAEVRPVVFSSQPERVQGFGRQTHTYFRPTKFKRHRRRRARSSLSARQERFQRI